MSGNDHQISGKLNMILKCKISAVGWRGHERARRVQFIRITVRSNAMLDSDIFYSLKPVKPSAFLRIAPNIWLFLSEKRFLAADNLNLAYCSISMDRLRHSQAHAGRWITAKWSVSNSSWRLFDVPFVTISAIEHSALATQYNKKQNSNRTHKKKLWKRNSWLRMEHVLPKKIMHSLWFCEKPVWFFS